MAIGALVVTGRGSLESGRIKVIEDELTKAGVRFTIYSDFEPEPTLEQVEKLAEYVGRVLSLEKIDFVIGFGEVVAWTWLKLPPLPQPTPGP